MESVFLTTIDWIEVTVPGNRKSDHIYLSIVTCPSISDEPSESMSCLHLRFFFIPSGMAENSPAIHGGELSENNSWSAVGTAENITFFSTFSRPPRDSGDSLDDRTQP